MSNKSSDMMSNKSPDSASKNSPDSASKKCQDMTLLDDQQSPIVFPQVVMKLMFITSVTV